MAGSVFLVLAFLLFGSQTVAAIADCNRIDPKFGRAYCPNDFYDLSSVWFYEWSVTSSAPGISAASLYGTFAGISSSYVQSVFDPKCPNLNPPSFDTTDLVSFDCYGDNTTAKQAYAVGRIPHQTWTISNLSGTNTITVVFPDRDSVPALIVNFICDPNAPRYVLNITANTFSPTSKWSINVYTQAPCHPVPPCGVSVASALAGPWPMFQATRGRAGQTTLVGPASCHIAWRTFVGGPLTGSPVIGPNYKIYVGTANHFVFALGPNGQPRYRKQTTGPVQTPTVAQASPFFSSNITVYVPTLNQILALDPDSGVVVWNFTHPDATALCTSPAFSDFNFYYTGLYFTCGNTLYSANAARGRVEWSYAGPAEGGALSAVAMDPVNGTVYVGSTKGLFGFSAAGQSVFNFTDIGVLGLPTVSNHGNSIFFNGVDNQTYAVDAHSGLLIWSYPVSGSLSSAAIGPNCTLFLGSLDGKVYAIDAHTGFVQWQYQTGGRVDSSPAVDSQNTVYIGSYDHKLYALDGANGNVKWFLKTNSQIIASPAIAEDGNVLIGTANGYVYSITGDTSASACPTN